MIEQSVKALGIRFQARIQLDLFETLFRRRIADERIKLPKAMEADFLNPVTEAEQRIWRAIQEYRAYQGEKFKGELQRQKERLVAAERRLSVRSTKSAENELRIAGNKIAWYESKQEDLYREQLEPNDSRVFPQWYAPIVTMQAGQCVVRPMRYHLRPANKPASVDQCFDGLYNARRDSLAGFWRGQFGVHHGVAVVTSFFENVARHDYEHRALMPGEATQNLVVHFQPTPIAESVSPSEMLVPCLWDHWTHPKEPELWSFAAITDEPPPEVRATGHDRCVVALQQKNLVLWLDPGKRRDEELFRILSEREPYVYRHRLAG
jgi:putative SOS response-associated peptidase YedK